VLGKSPDLRPRQVFALRSGRCLSDEPVAELRRVYDFYAPLVPYFVERARNHKIGRYKDSSSAMARPEPSGRGLRRSEGPKRSVDRRIVDTPTSDLTCFRTVAAVALCSIGADVPRRRPMTGQRRDRQAPTPGDRPGHARGQIGRRR
jgi:hypothetical protein